MTGWRDLGYFLSGETWPVLNYSAIQLAKVSVASVLWLSDFIHYCKDQTASLYHWNWCVACEYGKRWYHVSGWLQGKRYCGFGTSIGATLVQRSNSCPLPLEPCAMWAWKKMVPCLWLIIKATGVVGLVLLLTQHCSRSGWKVVPISFWLRNWFVLQCTKGHVLNFYSHA